MTDAFPAVRLAVDTEEQRVCRPAGPFEVRRPYYSGKEECHTLKTQPAVGPDGLIESVPDTHPGSGTHDLTLLRSTGLLETGWTTRPARPRWPTRGTTGSPRPLPGPAAGPAGQGPAEPPAGRGPTGTGSWSSTRSRR